MAKLEENENGWNLTLADVRQAATRSESLRRGAIAVVAYVAFIVFFAYFPFNVNLADENELRKSTIDAVSAFTFIYLLVPVTIVTARTIGLLWSFALPIALYFVMLPSAPDCDGCTFDPARITLFIVPMVLVLPAIIGGLAELSERRGRGSPPKETLLVGLTALAVYAIFTRIIALFMDLSLDPNAWDWTDPNNSGSDLSASLYLWITSITAIAVGYQLPWRFACLLPIVFALVTLEAQEPDLSSSAPWRALLFSIVVILPCSLLGTKLRQIADRRAIGANETTTGIAETEHGPPAADH